jgi:hypothetical protein
MKYGLRTQTMTKRIIINNKPITKYIHYQQYGWYCSMKNDYCDIIFDIKDTDKNKQLADNANQ